VETHGESDEPIENEVANRQTGALATAAFFGILLALVTACCGCTIRFSRAAGHQADAPAEKAWWIIQTATPDEVAAQQWLADITCRLPSAREERCGMWGGSQHGGFSIRYQVEFSGYAAAALGCARPRTSA
jgi:hypothetical protein